MINITKFSGLANTIPQEKLPLGSLSVADNIVLTSAGDIKRRVGNSLVASGTKITGSYGTTDNVNLFLIDNGTLFRFDGLSFMPLANGFPIASSYWCEESPDRVFVMSGNIYAYIDKGIEVTTLHDKPLPIDNGINDLAFNTEAFPSTGVVDMTYHQGSIVLAVKLDTGLSRVQFSIPQEYHVFHLVHGRFEVPDEITAIDSVNGQLLIVCKHSTWVYTSDSRLLKLADYGSPIGKPISKLPDNGCLIWTTRGVVKYPEFENVTEKVVSLPPGAGCSTIIYEYNGEKYFLVCTDGVGNAYNKV